MKLKILMKPDLGYLTEKYNNNIYNNNNNNNIYIIIIIIIIINSLFALKKNKYKMASLLPHGNIIQSSGICARSGNKD